MTKETDDTFILTLPGGFTMHSGGEEYELGAYVQFCNKDGDEIVYWDKAEWQEAPEEVMGAILAILRNPEKLTSLPIL